MANVVKVAMLWTLTPHPDAPSPLDDIDDVVTTFHVQAVDSHEPPDAGDRAAIAGAALAWWQTAGEYSVALGAAYPTTVALVGLEVYNVQPVATPPDFFVNALPTGAHIGPFTLPPQCAYLCGLRTSLDERSARGRIYLPAFASSVALPEWNLGRVDEILQLDVGRLLASLAHWIGALEGGPGVWALAVYSRVLGTSLAVTHFEVPDVIATQRRRAFRPAGYLHVGLDGEPA